MLTASTALRRLRDAGLLVQKGRGSATYYLAAERLGLGTLSGTPQPLSSNPPALSSNLESLSSNPANAENEAARTSLLDGLPGSLAARLGSIGRRHPPQETQDLVVALCRLRAWRVDELALVLQRNPEVVRQNYLRPLMRDGRLAMTRPEEPNDPQQAYRATEGNDRSTIN